MGDFTHGRGKRGEATDEKLDGITTSIASVDRSRRQYAGDPLLLRHSSKVMSGLRAAVGDFQLHNRNLAPLHVYGGLTMPGPEIGNLGLLPGILGLAEELNVRADLEAEWADDQQGQD